MFGCDPSLPSAAQFIRLLGGAPVCVGTVQLADGTAPKGFLVEAAGLTDATDITKFGGWRRYVAAR